MTGDRRDLRAALAVDGTTFSLAGVEPRSTPLAPGDKAVTRSTSESLVEELAALQERLWAEHEQSLLVVFQAIDAGGKDGAVKKVFTGVNPQGVQVTSFGSPSEEELAHDFLWRVHQRVPGRGSIGIFNRSHYEDVIAVRVRELVGDDVWQARFGQIRAFEELLSSSGTTVVKFLLHISREEQAERLRARVERPDKRWKFRRGDLDDRDRWDDYMRAFDDAVRETSTARCPWYVVPADHKWYRDWAVLRVLVDTLADMDPRFPDGDDLSDVVIR